MFWNFWVNKHYTEKKKGTRKPYPVATHEIIDVVAKARCTSSDAGTETEFAVRNKASPFIILKTWTEAVAVDESTNCVKKRTRPITLKRVVHPLLSRDE